MKRDNTGRDAMAKLVLMLLKQNVGGNITMGATPTGSPTIVVDHNNGVKYNIVVTKARTA